MKVKYNKSVSEGTSKEKALIGLLKSKNCRCSKSPKEVDINEHWDYGIIDDGGILENLKTPTQSIKSGDKYHRIDVKSLKRNKRNDKEYTNDFHWVEMQNVNGKTGWVHGKADYIAFETKDSWLFVDRQKLADLVEDKCKGGTVWTSPPRHYYEIYSRKDYNRDDRVTKVPMDDLYEISDLNLFKLI